MADPMDVDGGGANIHVDESMADASGVAGGPVRGGGVGGDDSDDPIVARYDVYLTKDLASNAFVFQYPLRRNNQPYAPTVARVKPEQQMVGGCLAVCVC